MAPLHLQVEASEPATDAGRVDAVVRAGWGKRTWRFAAETKRLATPKVLRAAISQVRRTAAALNLPPLVIVPYLSRKQLDMFVEEGVSAADLCGNGVIQIEGRLFVYRTGAPNAYKTSVPIRNVYRGASSMVARVFLLRSFFKSVGAIRTEIERRSGRLSLSTVSKVLKSLEEDLILRRKGGTSRLIQADELLDKLAESFKRTCASDVQPYRWRGPAGEHRCSIVEACRKAAISLAITGAASVERYAVMPREQTLRFYCSEPGRLADQLAEELEPARRFPDIELIETNDPLAYFDTRMEDGLPYASTIQCWLELQAGDKRERDAARQVRQRIVDELAEQGASR